jgi:hypothetical protein
MPRKTQDATYLSGSLLAPESALLTVDDTIDAPFDFGHLGMVRIENGRWIDTGLFEAFLPISDRMQL